jgi:muramidase (phage lysozyme)
MDPITKYRLTHESFYIADPELGTVTKASSVYTILMTAIKIGKMLRYKKFKACAKYQGNIRIEGICRKEYDVMITRRQLNYLRQALDKCNETKDSLKCKDKISQQISKKTEKLDSYEKELERLKTT